MAATEKGVWTLQEVRDKALQNEWGPYDDGGDPFKLFAWGRNLKSCLGLNENGINSIVARSSPTQIPGTTWNKFSAGSYTNLAVKTDNTLWAWGTSGTYGNLGMNNKTEYSSPVQVGTDTTWSRPYSQNDMGGCIKTDGTMWMWGYGQEGALAQNNRTDYSSPRQIPGTTWSTQKGHFAGSPGNTTFAIKTDGTLWGWGYSRIGGQLGQNERKNYSSPVQVGTNTNWSWVSGSWQGCLAVNSDGEMFSWGQDLSGELGLNASGVYRSSPTQIGGTTWKQVSGQSTITIALKTDGTLWSWGNNGSGGLGLNDTNQYSSPKQVGTDTSWTAIHGGRTCALKGDGTLWAWGYNQYGICGQNNRTNYSSPIQIPGEWAKTASVNHALGAKPA